MTDQVSNMFSHFRSLRLILTTAYQSPLYLCTVFDSISYNIMRFSLLTHLLMCLPLETLMSIIRTG